jgi:DNA topoisomerase-1
MKITGVEKTEITGTEKNKLFPSDIAMLVNDFLIKYFPKVLDYKFTAYVESELDDIAKGDLNWKDMLKEFYYPFHDAVEHTIENSDRVSGERILGVDPKTKKQVSVRMARYGPVAVISDPDDESVKPEFAGLRSGQKLETIKLEEALDLFKLPRTVGEFENDEVSVSIGRFGPYVKHSGKFYSIPKDLDPYTIELDDAVEVIETKRKKDSDATLKLFEEDPKIKILKGRWGPFLKVGRRNVAIPKGTDIEALTYEDCLKLAEKSATEKKSTKKKKK